MKVEVLTTCLLEQAETLVVKKNLGYSIVEKLWGWLPESPSSARYENLRSRGADFKSLLPGNERPLVVIKGVSPHFIGHRQALRLVAFYDILELQLRGWAKQCGLSHEAGWTLTDVVWPHRRRSSIVETYSVLQCGYT